MAHENIFSEDTLIVLDAFNYAKKGFSVFPLWGICSEGHCQCPKGKECSSAGKHPIYQGGFKQATTNTKQIAIWWKEHPTANIGVATGNGLVVIDIDDRNGGYITKSEFEQAGHIIKSKFFVKTGNGEHHYFKTKESIACKTNLFKGIDRKGFRRWLRGALPATRVRLRRR